MSLCPICGKPLEENDQLSMHWYEPRRWFVLYHDKDVKLKYNGDGTVTDIRRPWCAVADHPSTHAAKEAFLALQGSVDPAMQS